MSKSAALAFIGAANGRRLFRCGDLCRTRCRGQSKDCRDIWRTRKSPISKAEYRCPEKSQAYTSTTHTTSQHKHNTKYRANFTPLRATPSPSLPPKYSALRSHFIDNSTKHLKITTILTHPRGPGPIVFQKWNNKFHLAKLIRIDFKGTYLAIEEIHSWMNCAQCSIALIPEIIRVWL